METDQMSNNGDGPARSRPGQDDDTAAGNKTSRSGEGSQSALDALKKARVPPAPPPAEAPKK
jgi:hypothetical protein